MMLVKFLRLWTFERIHVHHFEIKMLISVNSCLTKYSIASSPKSCGMLEYSNSSSNDTKMFSFGMFLVNGLESLFHLVCSLV